MSYRTSPCRTCGRQILWVQARCPKCSGKGTDCEHCHERGAVKVPLDAAAPVFVIQTDPDGESAPFAVLPPKDSRRAFVSHFSTCSDPNAHSGSKKREPAR